MSSASRYTSRLRSNTEARAVKVQQPTKQSVNTNALYSSVGSNPNYSTIEYPYIYRYFPKISLRYSVYDGGTPAYSGAYVYDGGSPSETGYPTIDGGGIL